MIHVIYTCYLLVNAEDRPMTMTMTMNDNENTLFDHIIQIEITIYKQFKGMEHVPNIFISFDKYLFLEVINILI